MWAVPPWTLLCLSEPCCWTEASPKREYTRDWINPSAVGALMPVGVCAQGREGACQVSLLQGASAGLWGRGAHSHEGPRGLELLRQSQANWSKWKDRGPLRKGKQNYSPARRWGPRWGGVGGLSLPSTEDLGQQGGTEGTGKRLGFKSWALRTPGWVTGTSGGSYTC
jgi:hypothetical protein